MLFSGMARGRRDPAHPLSEFRAERAGLDEVAELRGFG